jgi:hypothetical protein
MSLAMEFFLQRLASAAWVTFDVSSFARRLKVDAVVQDDVGMTF